MYAIALVCDPLSLIRAFLFVFAFLLRSVCSLGITGSILGMIAGAIAVVAGIVGVSGVLQLVLGAVTGISLWFVGAAAGILYDSIDVSDQSSLWDAAAAFSTFAVLLFVAMICLVVSPLPKGEED